MTQMTGPQHYREAERLAGRANHFTYGDGANPVVGAALAAEAQVHATLAHTAALLFLNRQATPAQHQTTEEFRADQALRRAWAEVAS
jgi:hypothetical protein